jgi:hypothetical protein
MSRFKQNVFQFGPRQERTRHQHKNNPGFSIYCATLLSHTNSAVFIHQEIGKERAARSVCERVMMKIF